MMSRALFILVVVLTSLCACQEAYVEVGCSDKGHVTSEVGSGGSSSDAGDDAQVIECTTDATCEEFECSAPTCIRGRCTYTPFQVGSSARVQTPGDCRKLVCMPGIAERIDDSDLPDDEDDCTKDTCIDGNEVSSPLPTGTTCTKGATCVKGACL